MANVGLVAVSHSEPLARAACDLARDMGRDAALVPAGGTGGDGFGTNAELIADAIEEADSGGGVVVLVDLGSAVMSAEMALEFIAPDVAERTTVIPAPLVEGLVVAAASASAGADRATVAREAMSALDAKSAAIPCDGGAQLSDSGSASAAHASSPAATGSGSASSAGGAHGLAWESRRFTIDDPAGLHARPAAALVAAVAPFDAQVRVSHERAGRGPNPANSMTALISLGVEHGDQILVQAAGPDAHAALAAVGELADRSWAARPEDKPEVSTIPAHKREQASSLDIAVGPALVWRPRPRNDASHTADNQAAAVAEAGNAVRDYFASLGNNSLLALQTGLLDDPAYTADITSRIERGQPAEIAIRGAIAAIADTYRNLPTAYLRERADDVVALGDLLTQALRGEPLGGLSEAIADSERAPIIVLESLTPALAAEIDEGSVMGIVAATGSTTGHGALIATAKGIPLVAGHADAREIDDGVEVAIEPRTGALTVNPSREQLRELLRASKQQQRLDAEALEHAHEPAIVGSLAAGGEGRRVVVGANVAMLADAKSGANNGADGSGLVRTEVLFGEYAQAPTVAEQVAVFAEIAEALGADKPITIRTWDVGADKPVSFFPVGAEDNPFLGVRGIRLMRQYPQALVDQFRAIIRVAQQANIQAMVPMVTTVDELRWARERFNDAVDLEGRPGVLPDFGMMIETPATAIRVQDFNELIDFASVGTNDLIQYVAAADRGNADVAEVAAGVVPLVIDLIANAAKELDGPVSVCGDLASAEEHVPALVTAGVHGLSVRPGLVPRIKQAVRRVELPA